MCLIEPGDFCAPWLNLPDRECCQLARVCEAPQDAELGNLDLDRIRLLPGDDLRINRPRAVRRMFGAQPQIIH